MYLVQLALQLFELVQQLLTLVLGGDVLICGEILMWQKRI